MVNHYQEVKLLLSNNIGVVHGDLFETLALLIKTHPNYDTWKFNIPQQMKIMKKKYIQLHILFEGTKKYRIVSWVQCCKKVTKKDPLTSAMRYAIKRQITIYKNNNINRICNICSDKEHIEVDHYPMKFVQIKNAFLLTIASPTQFIYHPKRGHAMFANPDAMFKKKWQQYHHKHATYRYLCSTCNKKYK